MPVVHSLLQVREEIVSIGATVPGELFWENPGGAASIGFHLLHLAGSLDRLLTYARGEQLNDRQRSALEAEDTLRVHEPPAPLIRRATEAIDAALEQVRSTPVETLGQDRGVGRAALPSTVRGLLFHAAEHAQRHAAQIVTTAKIARTRAIPRRE
jgi:DinB superfamily